MEFYNIRTPEISSIWDEIAALDPVVVAMDDGLWGIKAVGPAALDGTTFITMSGIQMATVDLGIDIMTKVNGLALRDPSLGTGALRVFGRKAANDASRDTVETTVSPFNGSMTAFFQAALSKVVHPGQTHVGIAVIGLPIRVMEDSGFVEATKKAIIGLHRFTTASGDVFEVVVDKCLCRPQASGLLYYSTITDDGKGTPELKEMSRATTLYYTSGGGTGEVLVMRPKKDDEGRSTFDVDSERSRSGPAGIDNIRRHLRETVFNGLPSNQRLNDAEIDDLIDLRAPKPRTWFDGRKNDDGKIHGNVNIEADIETGRQKMCKAMVSLIENAVGLPNVDIRYAFLGGGTAPWVQDEFIQVFGRERVVLPGERPGHPGEIVEPPMDHPERVVAIGLYRYGQFKLARKK